MRLCIDATPLLLRSAGVKGYVYHWIRALQQAGPRERISMFPFFSSFGELDHSRSMAAPLATLRGLALLHAANYSPLPLLDWMSARWDVFHASHQLQSPPRRTRLTATIHDMTCWLMPELHRPRNVAFTRNFGERFLPGAAGLIAVSEATRQDAIRILRLKPERISTVHSGIDERFFDAIPAPSAKPYLLSLGTIEPRKNLGALLDAWSDLPASVRQEYDLVVAGAAGWGEETTLARLNSGVPGVRYLGYVPEADLPGLTAGAAAFVYPSLYEGFGFPVAQAMAAGVPVITSAVSSLPEIAGDGALLVDPRSRQELREAMLRLAQSPSLRAELSGKGRRRAERFRWSECAAQSLAFFRELAGA